MGQGERREARGERREARGTIDLPGTRRAEVTERRPQRTQSQDIRQEAPLPDGDVARTLGVVLDEVTVCLIACGSHRHPLYPSPSNPPALSLSVEARGN